MSLDYARHHLAAAVVDDLVSLLLGTAIAASTSGEDVHLATLANLA